MDTGSTSTATIVIVIEMLSIIISTPKIVVIAVTN